MFVIHRASPFGSSGYSSYADSSIGDVVSASPSTSFVQSSSSSSSYYAASSSTSFSSSTASNLRSPNTENRIQDYRRQSDNRYKIVVMTSSCYFLYFQSLSL